MKTLITIEQIQRNLSEAIKQSGKTQTEIGKSIVISQQTVSHYMKGDKLPALDTLANLCVFLDIDPADILCTKNF